MAAALIEIMTYDTDGNHRHRRCPHGIETADVMITMADKRGEATVRRRRVNYMATTRQRRGNKDAKASAMAPQVQGQ
jgi:hypothetical protein